MRVRGIASTPDIDDAGDVILPGAFDQSIREKGTANIPLLLKHDHGARAGRIISLRRFGDLLAVEADLYTDFAGVTGYLEFYRAGGALGFSVGIGQHESKTAGDVRTIHRAELVELSLTATPMNRACTLTFLEGITP